MGLLSFGADFGAAAHFKLIRTAGAFEDPYFFLSQLFDPEWEPVSTV
jgi:hypothetical protein